MAKLDIKHGKLQIIKHVARINANNTFQKIYTSKLLFRKVFLHSITLSFLP